MLPKDIITKLSAHKNIFTINIPKIQADMAVAQLQTQNQLPLNDINNIISNNIVANIDELLHFKDFKLTAGGIPSKYASSAFNVGLLLSFNKDRMKIFRDDPPFKLNTTHMSFSLAYVKEVHVQGTALVIETINGRVMVELPVVSVYE